MSRPTTPIPSNISPPVSDPPAPRASPLRSTTVPVKKHHHHRSHHIPHRHHHQRDKSVPQSAILPASTTSALDSLFSPITKATSRSEGAPDISSLIKDEREARARREAREKPVEKEDRAKLEREATKRGWDLVHKRRAARKGGEEALAASLQSLSTLSTSTTRRLDYTYYSLLSHISSLHNTLESLSSLSSTTSTLLSTFTSQSGALSQDLGAQISNHAHDIDTQASQLKGLEERMTEGKRRVEDLGVRMEKVRNKIREQETREGEWSGRIRRRVRLCWGVLALALILGLIGLVVRHWPSVEPGIASVEPYGAGSARGVEEITKRRDGNGSALESVADLGVDAQEDNRSKNGGSHERVLKILDEL